MPFADVNWIAVLASTVAGFVFGALWYSGLGKAWLAALGKTEAELTEGYAASPLPYVIAFAAQATIGFFLMQLLVRLNSMTLGSALAAALVLWLAFILGPMAVNHSFQRASRRLTLIDAGHWLGVLLLQALVISLVGL